MCLATRALLASTVAAILAFAQPGQCEVAPSVSPQIRVVQTMHNAAIGQIRTDARFERLVTVSADKTVRTWRLSDLRPLRTVYLPSEPGPEGTPNAVAVSSDGAQIYAAGYTGWQWHGGAHVYVIDAQRGRVERTLGRFQGEVITALDLSPDGRRLAVGLGRKGLVVIDTSTGSQISADQEYASDVFFLHHAADGRLAASSSDGCLRVYAVDGTLVHRSQYPPIPLDQPQCRGGELGGIRFSPDGRWLALGVRYAEDGGRAAPQVALIDGNTLQLRRVIRASDADQRSLCCIAWSPDSSTLYVNGIVEGTESTPLYRVRNPLAGPLERWNVGRQAIANMLPMPDGSVVFATTAPSIVRVGADGRVQNAGESPLVIAPSNVDFHSTPSAPKPFQVTPDGRAVSFPIAGGRWLTARPLSPDLNRVLTVTAPPSESAATRPSPLTPNVQTSVGHFSHLQATRVNGQTVTLSVNEDVQSWAASPSSRLVAFGTQWRLLLVNERGQPVANWKDPPFLSGPAFHTVFTDDGRFVVVALGDGTIRWYEVASGRERLGLFADASGIDWVVWRPDGYYTSSAKGDRFVGWLTNRGEAQSPDFVRAVQYERELYRPDLVRTALDPNRASDATPYQLAATLKGLAAPRVRVESVVPGAEPGTLSVRFSVEATGRPIREVGVYVDDLPALMVPDRFVPAALSSRLERTVTVPATSSAPSVRVEAESEAALGMDESVAEGIIKPASPARRGRLWVVATGISKFDSLPAQQPLPFTTNDAREIAEVFRARSGALFADVRAIVLTEESGNVPTKANILARLGELDAMRPEDTLIVFIASHGITDEAEYYVVTKDATSADVDRLLKAIDKRVPVSRGDVPSMLSGTEILNALRRLPGRRILMLDTCFAASGNNSNPYSLVKRSASSQLAIMSASSGDESSYESTLRRHGVFTAAIIDALSSRSPASTAPLTLRDVFDAATPQVQSLLQEVRKGARSVQEQSAIRQTPSLVAPRTLEDSAIASGRR